MSLTHTHKWITDNGKTLTTTEKVSLLIAVNADIKETQTASTNSAITPPEERDCDTCANDGDCYVTMLQCKGYRRAAQ